MHQIIKSANDRRLFRHIKLSNELEALLISDPQTRKAAASLSINIGSINDGQVEGMAHFLEHMLFMGSQKYPDENRYQECVSENGGGTNAYTSSDHTNYYFDCVPEGFLKVLDIFAQFFISPLLKPDAVDRELLAVDSEYRNGLSSDPHMLSASKKQFMIPHNPASKFNWGNITTLKIPNIREQVMAFYNKYYSSHLMKLVVTSTESLDELQEAVISMFSLVPQKSICVSVYDGFSFKAPIYGELLMLKDDHVLDMIWEYEIKDNHKIHRFFGHLIGHEGPGSLHELLNQRFFVKSLHAGAKKENNDNYKFKVSMQLTDIGFQNINIIKQIVLDYIHMTSTATLSQLMPLYNELKSTSEEKLKNYIVPDAGQFAEDLSGFWATHDIEPRNLIIDPYVFVEYDINLHNLVTGLFSNMTYSNAVVFVSSKSFNDQKENMLVEKWFDGRYKKYDQIPELNQNLQKIDMTLPLENKYICKNNQEVYQNNLNNINYPQSLPLDNILLYWQQDTSFGTPDIHFVFNVALPNQNSVVGDILSKLYIKCWRQIFNAELYNINCANYQANISKTKTGVAIHISGYPEKFMLVLSSLVESVLNMKDKLTSDIFDNIKNIYLKELQNYKYQNPYQQISYELSTRIQKNTYTIMELFNTLEKTTYDDLLRYELFNKTSTVKKLKSDSLGNKLYGLVEGNINLEEALLMGKYLVSKFDFLVNNEYYFEEQLIDTNVPSFVKELENKEQVNSCHKLVIKIGYLRPETNDKYIEILSCLQVLNEIISEQYFDQLRTKEQLGYVVNAFKYNYGQDESQLYTTYDFVVQSPSKDTNYLKNRTLQFIKEFKDTLINKTDDSIKMLIDSQVLSLQKPFQNLEEKTHYNFSSIVAYGIFNSREKKANFMKNLTKKDLVEFYDQYFSLQDNTFWSMSLEKCSK